MKDALAQRGVDVLGALVNTGDDTRAMTEARAWERDVIAAFPSLVKLGQFSAVEEQRVKEHVRRRVPRFEMATGSTYTLTEGDIRTAITTVVVRLYRLQHGPLGETRNLKVVIPDAFKAYVADHPMTGKRGEIATASKAIAKTFGCEPNTVEKIIRESGLIAE